MNDTDSITMLDDASAFRRPLLVVLGLVVLAAMVMGSLAWFGTPSDPDVAVLSEQEEAPDGETDVAEDAESTEPGDEGMEPLPVTTYEVYLARDPFDPVVPEDEPTDSNGQTTDPDGSTDPDTPAPDPDDPASSPDPDDPDAPSPGPDDPSAPGSGCEGDQQEVVCDGRVVSLLEVASDADGSDLAVIQVDTTVYEVRHGERFASNFELSAFQGECVSVLHGDEGFQLCEGERVLK